MNDSENMSVIAVYFYRYMEGDGKPAVWSSVWRLLLSGSGIADKIQEYPKKNSAKGQQMATVFVYGLSGISAGTCFFLAGAGIQNRHRFEIIGDLGKFCSGTCLFY